MYIYVHNYVAYSVYIYTLTHVLQEYISWCAVRYRTKCSVPPRGKHSETMSCGNGKSFIIFGDVLKG